MDLPRAQLETLCSELNVSLKTVSSIDRLARTRLDAWKRDRLIELVGRLRGQLLNASRTAESMVDAEVVAEPPASRHTRFDRPQSSDGLKPPYPMNRDVRRGSGRKPGSHGSVR